MNAILKLLYVVTITVLLVSCGGNNKDEPNKTKINPNPNHKDSMPTLVGDVEKKITITEVLKKKSVIYGKAESFEFNLLEEGGGEKFNITMIVMSADMDCAEEKIDIPEKLTLTEDEKDAEEDKKQKAKELARLKEVSDAKKICPEIFSFIGGNKLVFSSSEEYALIEEESPEYRMMQKGTIEINDNTYSGTLYYNGEGDNEAAAWFHGKLIFKLPAISSLKGEPLIIEIKGKK